MSTTIQQNDTFIVSQMAENLIGSEIIKLANEVNEKIRNGEKIANLTIGDFDPSIFPIPTVLLDETMKAYKEGHTNYPVANGMLDLRKAVAEWIYDHQSLSYSADEVLIAGGARPLIYAIYATLLDPGDKVIFPVPSWNNNHYCHLLQVKGVAVEAMVEDNFMPTAKNIAPHLKDARLLALCSPQNPTGTVFSKVQLQDICDLVLEENLRRGSDEKPLYIMYDQIYSALTFADEGHIDPVTLCPALRPYTIFVDGLSKSFAATGIRVGWSFGPAFIIDKMKSILSHIGAWAPKAEQVASARFISNKLAVNAYMESFSIEIQERLNRIYAAFDSLNKQGLGVRCVEPMAAIYLTVQFDLKGKKTASGKVLETTSDITAYILNEAKMAIVPFSAFGASAESTWYRLSIGTCKKENIDDMMNTLKNALVALS
jgi:aspartate aminotransferase